MSSKLYLVGAALVVAGLIYVAYLLHVPPKWIAAITIILVGIAIWKPPKLRGAVQALHQFSGAAMS